MGWPAIILCLIVLAASIKQIRDNRRRGIAIDWGKTLVTAAAAILIAALATGAFYGAMALGAPTTGAVLFFVVFLVGVIALAVVVNRRWPGAKAR
jgi:drug/metabolite transporter (DMT)-like permease